MTPNRLLTPKEQTLILALAVAMLAGAGSLYFFGHRREPTASAPPTATAPVPAPKTMPPHARAEALRALAPAQSSPVVATPPVSASRPVREGPVASALDRAESPSIMVSVIGAVKQPGAYTLLSTARVSDLLRAADGLLPGADVSSINLAARLIDGSTLAIPSKTTRRFQNGVLTARGGQPVPSHNPPQYTLSRGVSMQASPSPIPVSTATSDAGSGLLDLNTASEKELDTLPGIGPKLASEIVRYRTTSPFQSVDDILNVPGIGEKKAEMIRPLVTVSPTRQ